jgi:soluble lytic murein transglycosylase
LRGVRAFRTAVLMLAPPAVAALGFHIHTTRYDRMISLAAARYELDFCLVKAVIFEESWFRPDIRGSQGELGLMQVSEAAAADFAAKMGISSLHEERLLEPRLNLEIGCWYIRQSLDRYRSSPARELFALLRYNAGAARADGWLKSALSKPVPAGIPPERYYLSLVDISSTRAYASHVLARRRTRFFWF